MSSNNTSGNNLIYIIGSILLAVISSYIYDYIKGGDVNIINGQSEIKEDIIEHDINSEQRKKEIMEIAKENGNSIEETNVYLRKIWGEDYKTMLEDDATYNSIKEKIQNEGVDEIADIKEDVSDDVDHEEQEITEGVSNQNIEEDNVSSPKSDLMTMDIRDVNDLTENSPSDMLVRLKKENAETIEYLSTERYSNVIETLISKGYAEDVVTSVINDVNFRNIKISQLNSLAKEAPTAMMDRLKNESADIVEYVATTNSTYVMEYLIKSGYAKNIVKIVIEESNLRNFKISQLNSLAKEAPKEMLERLKVENADNIKYIATTNSTYVLEYLIKAGYAKDLVTSVIKKVSLRDLKISQVNDLTKNASAEMVIRLKDESKEIIQYIATTNSTYVLEYLIQSGYAKDIIISITEVLSIRDFKISQLNTLAKEAPNEMVTRLKDENADIVEYISDTNSTYVIEYLIQAGYSVDIVNSIINVANLRNLKISQLNDLAKNAPEQMQARLKTEDSETIEYLKNASYSYIFENLEKAGYPLD